MNIIKSELYKLKKSKPFWVCLLVCVFMAVLLPFALLQGVNSGDPDFQGLSLSAVEVLCFSFGMPILTMIASIFTSIFVSGEFHNGTMKNYVSKGMNRGKLFLSKFGVSAFAVTLMAIVYIPANLIAGTVFLGFDPNGVFNIATFVFMILAVWLLMMAYTAVFTAVGMTLRSSGASIGVNICLVSIFPTLLSAIDFIFSSLGFSVSKWWIDANISAVATMTPESGAVLTGVIVGAIWLLIGIVGGTALFQREDIK